MRLEKYKDSHGNYFEFSTINKSLSTIFIHGVGLDNTCLLYTSDAADE